MQIEQDFLGATEIWSHITEEVLYAFCGKQMAFVQMALCLFEADTSSPAPDMSVSARW